MNAFIIECVKANKEIYNYINHELKAEDYLYHEDIGEGGDKSLNMDLYAESVFVKYLSSFGNIYSEESGFIKTTNENQKDFTIIIDPLDGSDNFSSSLPYYGTAVAFEHDNNVQIGVVCNLNIGLIYIKDENKISYTSDMDGNIVDDHVLKHGKPKFGIFERAYIFPDLCLQLKEHKLKYRSPGAVALSFACAKYYNFVLFRGSVREFDVKAALYICNDLHVYEGNDFLIIAKNKNVFFQLKKLLNNI